jgi:hypothetical protein
MVLYVSPSAVHTGACNLCARYTAHKSLLIIIPSTAVPYTLFTAYTQLHEQWLYFASISLSTLF